MKIKKLPICHVNVRSLLAQTHLLELEILTASHSIDVLCLSKTWLSADRAPSSSNIMLPGFQLAARHDRAVGCGGGVAIYMWNGVAAAPLPLSCSVECVGIQLSFEKRRKFNVVTAYRPPCSSMSDFIDDLESCLFEGGALAHHPLCLVGDFNCKSAQWWNVKSDSADGRLLECCRTQPATSC